ncbi:MAG: hypothetical protein AB8B51_15260 [Sedimentitalea sp.]
MQLTPQQAEFLKKTLGIQTPTEAIGPAQDMLPVELGAEYQDEEKQVGWRVDENDPRKTHDFVRTAHYSDAERQENTLTPDGDGKMRHPDGTLADGTKLFAMGLQGDVVVEDGTARSKLYELDTNGNPISAARDSKDLGGNVAAMGYAQRTGLHGVINTHHSTMLAGAASAGAGHLRMVDGQVNYIDNDSGHYKPAFEHLLQMVEELTSKGAMLDKELVDIDGNSIEQTAPEAGEMFRALGPLAEQIKQKQAALAASGGEDTEAALQDLMAQVHLLDAAQGILRERGIGPRNAYSGVVKLTHANPDADGKDFKNATARTEMSTKEFLSGAKTSRTKLPGGETLGPDGQPITGDYGTVGTNAAPAPAKAAPTGKSKTEFRKAAGRQELMDDIQQNAASKRVDGVPEAGVVDGVAPPEGDDWEGRCAQALAALKSLLPAAAFQPASNGPTTGPVTPAAAYTAPPVSGAGAQSGYTSARTASSAPPPDEDFAARYDSGPMDSGPPEVAGYGSVPVAENDPSQSQNADPAGGPENLRPDQDTYAAAAGEYGNVPTGQYGDDDDDAPDAPKK